MSGTSPESLRLTASRLQEWLDGPGSGTDLLDLAHTLTSRRSPWDHRLCVTARDSRELADKAGRFAADEDDDSLVSGSPVLPPEHAGPVFVFTGQGSQRPGMCQGLLENEPVFAEAIAELEPLIAAEAGFSVREMIEQPDLVVGVDKIQPTLFAVQVALAAVWRSWGVEPAAVIGQSLGEVAALVVAGGLSAADGAKVICRRSALLATISGGAMASVMTGADQVREAIEAAGADGVSLGVLTSPSITTVSGDAEQIAELVEELEDDGVVAKLIDVDVASHSPQVDPILDELRTALADIAPAHPRIPFFSTVSTDPEAYGALDGEYWVRNQRDPVRFDAAVSSALSAGHRVFVECPAHPLAVRPILDTAAHLHVSDVAAVGTLRQPEDDQRALLANIAALHVAGYDGIDFARRYGRGHLVDVPGTAWHRTRFGGEQAPYRLVAPALPAAAEHPLLGGHVQDPDRPDRHSWQTPIGPDRLPWLADHRVADVPVLPGTAFGEMLLAAGRRVFGTDQVTARDVALAAPLLLDPEPVVTTRLTRDGDTAEVEVVSVGEGEVTVHARGTVTPAEHPCPPPLTEAERAPEGWHDTAPADLHHTFRERHNVFHGPAFTAIDRIRIHPDEDLGLSFVHTHETAQVSAGAMAVHPALTDQVVQTAVAVWLACYSVSPGPVVVAGFDEITVYRPTAHTRVVAATVTDADDLGCTASARLATADGTVVAEIRGLRVANITPAVDRFTTRLSRLAWVSEPAPDERHHDGESTWTVITTDEAGWPEELGRELDERTAGCRVLPCSAAIDADTPPDSSGVVLALAGDDRTDDPATTARERIRTVIAILRRLAESPQAPRVWLLARDPGPLSAAAPRAVLRTLAYEHPDLDASYLELDPDRGYGTVVDELLDTGQPITEIALRPDDRRIARVVAGPQPGSRIDAHPRSPIRTSAAYLVTGGLGGLGLCTVEWLARRGAGRVVISGRSAPSDDARAVLDAAKEAGTEIDIVRGDIADPAIAEHAVRRAGEDGLELRGVLHCAGVVEDATLATLDEALIDRVWQGKATGAWTLHQVTGNTDLDFFVLFSSVAALIGSPGQTAYAAANAFLDGLAVQRRREGLPATSIHWGPWSEVGRGRHLAERGFLMISPTDGIDALERILAANLPQIAYSPLDIAQWIAPYPGLSDSALFAEMLTDTGVESEDDIRAELADFEDPGARREHLETFIIDTVRELLGGTSRRITAHTSVVILGLDSLGAVQLQQKLQRALKTEMKPGVIWVKPTAASLAEWLLDHTGLAGQSQP